MQKKMALQFYLYCLLFIGSSSVFAQSDSIPAVNISTNVDLLSHYIWRGQNYGQTPGIQPGLSVSWKDFTLGFWGAYRIAGSGDHETDFYLEKTIGPATFSVWDYWSHSDSSSNNYFDYSRQTTSHMLEAQVLLTGGEKLPFNLLGSYFFYGADQTKSLYFELQYLHSFGSFDTQAFAGFQAKGEYYAPKAAFVNVGISVAKSIKMTKNRALPMNISIILNPNSAHVYSVVGITILTL